MHAKDSLARQREALLSLVQLDKSDFGAALARTLEAAAQALEVARVSYWRLSDDAERIACERMIERRLGTSSPATLTVPFEHALEARDYPRYFAALLDASPVVAHDARTDPRTSELTGTYLEPHGIGAVLDVPVVQNGALAGVLGLEHVGQAREWQPNEIDFTLAVAGMIAVALDGVARRRAEARYHALTIAMEELIWDWDLRTQRIAWSEAALPSLRYRPEDVRPNVTWWRENLHPDDLQRVLGGLLHHVGSGQGVWRNEYRFRRGDGSWAIIADRGVVERSPDGTPLRMVGAMVDVSETRALERRLVISDRMASLGTLAAGVAHEINNPLSFVGLNLDWAIRSTTAPAVRAALEEAREGVERVRQIVRDLNTFARPDQSEQAAVDVREPIASALGIALNELRHRARVREEHVPAPPARCSAARLGQVMLNLLINAAHAIPKGTPEEHEILIRSGPTSDGRVRIEVLDTGVGVAPDVLKRAFDPFFTTKAVGEGTGLGLAICHSIVVGAGGTLTLENRPDKGAIARVELPAAPRELLEAAPAATPASADPPSRRGRVLIIDDLPNVGRSMKLLLQDEHEVDICARAREALAQLEQGARWDVILCDLMMPELNGMEFVAEVRRIAPEMLPRIVVMSGGAFTEQARQFLELWPYRVLEKPIAPDLLVAEVARAVREVTRPAA